MCLKTDCLNCPPIFLSRITEHEPAYYGSVSSLNKRPRYTRRLTDLLSCRQACEKLAAEHKMSRYSITIRKVTSVTME